MAKAVLKGDDGIDENGKIGTQRCVCIILNNGFAIVGAGCGGKMPAGGEAHDADLFGIDIPFGGALADGFDGLLGILQRSDFAVRHGGIVGDAVFEDKSGNALLYKFLRFIGAFVFGGEDAVAAAGADDDGSAGGELFRWQVYGERGSADFADDEDAVVVGGFFVVGEDAVGDAVFV